VASWDASRGGAWCTRRSCRAVDEGAAEAGAERQEVGGEQTDGALEEFGGGGRERRGPEPTRNPVGGITKETRLEHPVPTPERALGDRLLAFRIAPRGPGERGLHPLPHHPVHRRQDRADRRAAPPHGCRLEGTRTPIAEPHPDDGDVLMAPATFQVPDRPATPHLMALDAEPRTAPPARDPGLNDQGPEIVRSAHDHGGVVSEVQSKYTVDWLSWVAGLGSNLSCRPYASVAGWGACRFSGHAD